MTNKFSAMLSAGHSTLRQTRAENITKQVKLEQESLINKIESDISKLEGQIDTHTDLGPTQTTDLTATGAKAQGGKDFDARAWVERLQGLKVDLAETKVRLGIAKETYKEWFTDEYTGDTKTPKG